MKTATTISNEEYLIKERVLPAVAKIKRDISLAATAAAKDISCAVPSPEYYDIEREIYRLLADIYAKI